MSTLAVGIRILVAVEALISARPLLKAGLFDPHQADLRERRVPVQGARGCGRSREGMAGPELRVAVETSTCARPRAQGRTAGGRG